MAKTDDKSRLISFLIVRLIDNTCTTEFRNQIIYVLRLMVMFDSELIRTLAFMIEPILISRDVSQDSKKQLIRSMVYFGTLRHRNTLWKMLKSNKAKGAWLLKCQLKASLFRY